jgi:hypothetical protein
MRLALVSLSILALTACGPKDRPQKPFILTDRASIGFGMEFDSGTYIGTKPQESISISNEGLEDLIISAIELTSGAPEFSIMRLGTPPITVKGAMRTYLQIYFEPMAVRMYSGNIRITSNADNQPTLDIALSGRGIAPVTDGG